ncbi:TIGR01777 family oxidoreductase [Desulfospira joergensenii]|uniref:TIGR01777 family oxidoreductase n=1 Tax=Desulfospira joergensenii TaxID=53329 RepID=UPI000416EB1D|nr:TIGR01777 family oxidoreductase [Desulfospira joergensenii]
MNTLLNMKPRIYTKRTRINVPVEAAFAWHARNGAILRLTPPWAPLKMISRSGIGIDKGVKVLFRIKVFKIPMAWEAEHIVWEKNRMFRDCQTRGPFALWEHTHRFLPQPGNSTVMEDEVKFKLPLGWLSRPFYRFAEKELDRMFSYRHRVLKHDLENHADKGSKKRILVSGASGTIGSILVPFLRTCGHEVIRLVRKTRDLSGDELFWDPSAGILDLGKTGPFDAVINLNGLDISRGRWTPEYKKKIIDSRVLSTRLLASKISGLDTKPEVFISSSAIGFYGDSGDRLIEEEDTEGECFISAVCSQWEDASSEARNAGIRTVLLRIGVVLTPAGGALAKMELPFRLGLGVKFGRGSQYMSWISMEDTLSAILHILENGVINGQVNLTAPNPVTNREFSRTLASVFHKKLVFTLPGFLVRLFWGEMGKETLMASTRVMPGKLLDSGFSFQHETLEPALRDMLGR